MTPRRARRGSQAAEFALVVPVLLAVLAAVADYGYYYFLQHDLVIATQEAVRHGSMAAATQDPVAIAKERAAISLEQTGLSAHTPVVVAETVGVVPDMGLRVTISIEHDPLVGLVPVPDQAQSSITARLWYQPKPLPPEI